MSVAETDKGDHGERDASEVRPLIHRHRTYRKRLGHGNVNVWRIWIGAVAKEDDPHDVPALRLGKAAPLGQRSPRPEARELVLGHTAEVDSRGLDLEAQLELDVSVVVGA